MKAGQLLVAAFCAGLFGSAAASRIDNRDVNLVKRATTTTTSSTTSALVADASCTFGPTTRDCWSDGYSVADDFDTKWPTTGVTRYYTLTISNTTCDPDGSSPKRVCLLINGQYPGPTITANWGDYIEVTVNNNMKHNGTTLHWHGIRQYETNAMDGVPGVTECPIAPGQSEVYTFQATQFGTSWYHSHFSVQYGDGVVGPLVINGPASANYDIDMGPLLVSDWFYPTAFQIEALTVAALQEEGAGPSADNILINGTNMNPAQTTGKFLTAKLTTGKKHLFRIINTSVDNSIRVSLDGHTLQLLTSDFVPIIPITVESVVIAIGQRYEVIIDANQTAGNYWFRAEVETNCNSTNAGIGLANFYYSTAKKATPTSVSTYTNGGNCNEPSPLTPWVPNTVGDVATFQSQVSTLDLSLAVPGVSTNNQGLILWGLNFTTLDVQWEVPTLSYLISGNDSFLPSDNIITLPTQGIWAYWILQEVEPNVAIYHPIHLHGHDFYLLGSGTGTFDTTTDAANLQYVNPTRRDTAFIPAGGWMVLAFPTDNPGAWMFHCHIAWHISEGLGAQFLETASLTNLPGSSYQEQCAAWDAYYPTSIYKKDDSGL